MGVTLRTGLLNVPVDVWKKKEKRKKETVVAVFLFCFVFLFTKYSKAKAILLSTVNLCMYQSSGSQYKYRAQSQNSSYRHKLSLQLRPLYGAIVTKTMMEENDTVKIVFSQQASFPQIFLSLDDCTRQYKRLHSCYQLVASPLDSVEKKNQPPPPPSLVSF